MKTKRAIGVAITMMLVVSCNHSAKRKLLDEIVINYQKTDVAYVKYGYYKEIYRKYNYDYKDSTIISSSIDSAHGVHNIINEFGDTVHQIYIDYSNYPRREE